MRKITILPIIIYLSISFISCSGEEKTNSTPNKKTDEIELDTNNVTAENGNSATDEYNLGRLLFDLSEISFASELFENLEDAKAYFDEKGLTYQTTFSPEETRTTLWVTLETTDKKNMVELNYTYYGDETENGHYLNFRNIITKIDPNEKERLVKLLKETTDAETLLTARKYKKDYGEEGYVWYEEGTGQAMQTILSYKGGNTDWIELRRTDYLFVTEKEMVE
jgi:hypothetical protein